MFTRMMPSRAIPRSWSGMASRPSGTWFGWVIMVFEMVEVGRFQNGCFQPSFPHSPNLPAIRAIRAIRACHAGENFRKTLRGVNKNARNGLAVESAEVGFIAGEEDLAPVLDGRGEHGAVFFWEEKVEARDGQGGREMGFVSKGGRPYFFSGFAAAG